MVNIEQVNSTVEGYVQFDVHCPGRQIPKDPEGSLSRNVLHP